MVIHKPTLTNAVRTISTHAAGVINYSSSITLIPFKKEAISSPLALQSSFRPNLYAVETLQQQVRSPDEPHWKITLSCSNLNEMAVM